MKYPRELKTGERVRVYRNLHTGSLSVQGRNPAGGFTVVNHAQKLVLKDAKFLVSQVGRAKVIKNKVKPEEPGAFRDAVTDAPLASTEFLYLDSNGLMLAIDAKEI